MDASVSLPVELWIAVFREIFHFPGRFDTSPLDPLSSEPRSYTVSENEFIWNHQWSVILVSKQWCTLCLPILYKHLIIRHLEHLEPLARALDIGSVTTSISGCPISYGVRTKRMDIILNAPQRWTDNQIHHFETIRSACPNLEIFCDATGNATPRSVLCTLIRHHGVYVNSSKPLRHIRWAPGDPTGLRFTIEELSKFSAIEVMMVEFGISAPHDFTSTVSLPRLHTLRLQGTQLDAVPMATFLCWMSHWDIPAISRLILSWGFFWSASCNTFFTEHGAKIKHLDIACVENNDAGPRCLEPCVNLENVVISDESSFSHFPSSLRRVTIHSNIESFPATSTNLVLQTVYNVEDIIREIQRIPDRKLSSIRLINFPWDVAKGIRLGDAAVKDWVEELAAQGIKLEDEHGEIFQA
jgi:hypothetical protein